MQSDTRERISDETALRAFIRNHGSPDPGVVVDALLALDLDIGELRVLARVGLRGYARTMLTDAHPSARMRGRSGTENATPGTNPSKRMRRIVDHYQEALRRSIYGADHTWMTLGECRVEHLRYAAKGRREKSDAILAEADRYDQLAAALEQHHVDTVADLPRAVAEPLIL